MKPCSTCPWAKTSQLGHWHPAHLIGIAYAMSGDVPSGSMGCHKWNGQSSPARQPKDSPPCGGWIRVARDSVMVRVMVLMGVVDEKETYEGLEDLFPDVQTMLRWNGINVDALPPLKWKYGGDQPFEEWVRSVAALRSSMDSDPESAWEYVIPGSPMECGLDEQQQLKMSASDMEEWLQRCVQWSAQVTIGDDKEGA